MGLTVEVLNLGTVGADSSFTVFGRPPGMGTMGPSNGFLILGAGDPIMVDSGTRNAEVIERLGIQPLWDEDQTLEAQLAKHGLEPGDIGMVIQTHLHVDHAGRLDAYPMTTPVIVSRAELSFAFSGAQTFFYAPEDMAHVLERMYTPGALGILDIGLGERAAVAPGVSVMLLGGHTPGSVGVLVETDEGTACICGDVLYELQGSLVEPATEIHARVPNHSGNRATSLLEEKAAIQRALNAGRFLYTSHDFYGGVIEDGWIVGRVGPHLPGPTLPFDSAPQSAPDRFRPRRRPETTRQPPDGLALTRREAVYCWLAADAHHPSRRMRCARARSCATTRVTASVRTLVAGAPTTFRALVFDLGENEHRDGWQRAEQLELVRPAHPADGRRFAAPASGALPLVASAGHADR